MPTAPHAPDLDFVLKDNCDGLNKGIEILNSLTSGEVNIVMDRNKDYTIFKDAKTLHLINFQDLILGTRVFTFIILIQLQIEMIRFVISHCKI